MQTTGKVTGLGCFRQEMHCVEKVLLQQVLDRTTFWYERKRCGIALLGSQQRYNDQMQIVANSMLKTLLGEGSKNISNVDRQLAQEISGLVKGLASRCISKPRITPTENFNEYTHLIDKNQEAALGQVQSIASRI